MKKRVFLFSDNMFDLSKEYYKPLIHQKQVNLHSHSVICYNMSNQFTFYFHFSLRSSRVNSKYQNDTQIQFIRSKLYGG